MAALAHSPVGRPRPRGGARRPSGSARRARTDRASIVRLLRNARYEVLPTATTVQAVIDAVPPQTPVTVTASASKGLEATLAVAEQLAAAGYPTVPHLAARMISGRTELAEIIDRLAAAGIRDVFVPGGDADPVGEYADALGLLRDLYTLEHSLRQIGVTGYPESHPLIADDLIVQSMWDKRQYATHIVSNLTFDARGVGTWLTRLRHRGVGLPVLLGVPGPVELTKLIAMATRVGVGDSSRFLTKQGGLMTRLIAPGGFTGERFVEQCAGFAADPALGVAGLHVYTFNQVAATETWRAAWLDRLEG